MLFSFLKYVQPIWYFNIPLSTNGHYWLDWDKMEKKEQEILDYDGRYSNHYIAKLDVAYQALLKGGISGDKSKVLIFEEGKTPNIADNYLFLRKHFNPYWSIYVLIFRLLQLKNPILEIQGFIKSRSIKRLVLYNSLYPIPEDFEAIKSKVRGLNPKVSIILPTLNRYDYLENVLRDLERQDYKNFEIVIVDQSDPFQKEFYQQFDLDIKLHYQKEKALWKARNTAIRMTNSDYILLTEDDVSIQSNWIINHLTCVFCFKADISTGVFYPVNGRIPVNKSIFRWADQLSTGNACLRKSTFQKLGLFDRQFEKGRMGDGEYGLRAYLNGILSVSNPYSSCKDLKAPLGGLREMGSWDSFRPKKWFSPRPIPSVLYFYRKYFGDQIAIQALLINVPLSIIPYQFKRNKKLLIIGALFAFFTIPLVLIQVMRSWHISSKKLKEGPLIEQLQ